MNHIHLISNLLQYAALKYILNYRGVVDNILSCNKFFRRSNPYHPYMLKFELSFKCLYILYAEPHVLVVHWLRLSIVFSGYIKHQRQKYVTIALTNLHLIGGMHLVISQIEFLPHCWSFWQIICLGPVIQKDI